MHSLPVTLAASVILVAVFLVLSIRVTLFRVKTGISLGGLGTAEYRAGQEKNASPLYTAIRAQANFCEYVPLSIFILALLEYEGAAQPVVFGMAGALVVGRIIHPIGMSRPVPNIYRAGGILLNLLMLFAAAASGCYLLFSRWM